MRGLILLGLMGFILTASADDMWSTGSRRPLNNTVGFNSTTNSTINETMPTELNPEKVERNPEWDDGIRVAIKNTLGFRPPANGEDTELPQADEAPAPTQKSAPQSKPMSIWTPLENGAGLRPQKTDGNVEQEQQK
ncbi:uncharacterized protein [Pagrus major]|uniref:uncharacterized protein isoform X2 n=1 Tax=Pagrus major TaxID=143350 RepID=UPI003CC8BF87